MMVKISIFIASITIFSCKNSFAANSFQTNSSLANLDGKAAGSDYNKTALTNVIEYSLPYKMSLGTNFQLSYIDSQYHGGTNQYAWNFIEFWHRYRFYQDENFRISLQNLYKFPGSYEVNKNLGLGARQQDYEVRILTDYHMTEGLVNSLVHRSTPYLARFEVAYRRRFQNTYDEARFSTTLAYNINNEFTLMFQDSAAWNIYAKRNATTSSNTLSNFKIDNDAINVATFSTLYHLNDKAALQFGYVRKWHGINTTRDESGVVFALFGAF